MTMADVLCQKCDHGLKKVFGGQTLYVPKPARLTAADAKRLHRSGKTVREIATLHEMSASRVYQLLAAEA